VQHTDKQIPFYAQWVSRFLAFLNRNSYTKLDSATEQFIAWLRDSQHAQDWQLRQAGKARATGDRLTMFFLRPCVSAGGKIVQIQDHASRRGAESEKD